MKEYTQRYNYAVREKSVLKMRSVIVSILKLKINTDLSFQAIADKLKMKSRIEVYKMYIANKNNKELVKMAKSG